MKIFKIIIFDQSLKNITEFTEEISWIPPEVKKIPITTFCQEGENYFKPTVTIFTLNFQNKKSNARKLYVM